MNRDMTADCGCGLLQFPITIDSNGVLYECANRHRAVFPIPEGERDRRIVRNWIDKRAAQIDTQQRRREGT